VTPLEAVRRLANDPMESDGCSYCGATSQQQYRGRGDWCHLLSCPTRALPRIVAALEAAERAVVDGPYAGAYPGLGPYDPSAGCAMCGFCGEPTTRAHLKDCTWQALVAALGGEAKP
jgi:hypothetical protein